MSDDTLSVGEFHPSTHIAMEYVNNNLDLILIESIASTALSGNRSAELALGTIKRLQNKEPVSDRYLMGLAWFLYSINQGKGTGDE